MNQDNRKRSILEVITIECYNMSELLKCVTMSICQKGDFVRSFVQAMFSFTTEGIEDMKNFFRKNNSEEEYDEYEEESYDWDETQELGETGEINYQEDVYEAPRGGAYEDENLDFTGEIRYREEDLDLTGEIRYREEDLDLTGEIRYQEDELAFTSEIQYVEEEVPKQPQAESLEEMEYVDDIAIIDIDSTQELERLDTVQYNEEAQYNGEIQYNEEVQYNDEVQYSEEGQYYEENQQYSEDGQYYQSGTEYSENGQYYEDGAEYSEDGEYYEEGVSYTEDGQYYEDGAQYSEEQYYEEDDQYSENGQYYEEDAGYSEDGQYYEEDAYRQGDIYEEELVYVEPIRVKRESREQATKQSLSSSRKGKKRKAVLSPMDIALILGGAAVVIVAIIAGSIFLKNNVDLKSTVDFAGIRLNLKDDDMIGKQGILAVATAASGGQVVETPNVDETIGSEGYEEGALVKDATVAMSLTSVQKDLKIKMSNKETGKLISNVPFSVEVTGPDHNTTTWTDDDMDGVIYQKQLTPGSYKVALKKLTDEKYEGITIATAEQTVEVLKDIAYKKVDVKDEIKTEKEVDVAKEDTAKRDKTAESELNDTVEYVSSTTGDANYEEIAKSSIREPGVVAKAFTKTGASLNATSQSLAVGGTFQLSANYTDASGNSVPFQMIFWSSSNTAVAKVSDSGLVTAVANGTATISYEGFVVFTENGERKEEDCKGSCIITVGDATAPTPTPTPDPTNPSPANPDNPNGTDTELDGTETTGTVSAQQSSIILQPGSNYKTKVTATGFTAGKKLKFSVSSGNTAIADAAIDNSGAITVNGFSEGSTELKVVVNYTNGTAATEAMTFIAVTVSKDAASTPDSTAEISLTLDKTTATVAVGKEVALNASVKNAVENKSVTATSSNEAVATVSVNNKTVTVKGVAQGSATITVSYKEGIKEVTATCAVVVKSDSSNDTTTKLKDKNGNQVYVLENNKYREAVSADYYTAGKFYIMSGTKYTGWQTLDGKVYYFDKNGKKVTGDQVIQGMKYHFDANGVLTSGKGNGVLGIDVSKWNGDIDWSAVKNSGVKYVIIRCGYRGSSAGALIEDPKFNSNIKGASDAGLKVGVYFFSQAVDEVEAVYEASYVLEKISGYKLSYPVFLDLEASGGRGDAIDKATRTAVCKAFCTTIQNSGYTAGVYANKNWLEERIDTGSLANFKIWLAQYAGAPSYSGKYDIWQYKCNGKISGITGDVDLNTSYIAN